MTREAPPPVLHTLPFARADRGMGDRMLWKPCRWAFGEGDTLVGSTGALGPDDACSDLGPSHPWPRPASSPALGAILTPPHSWPERRGTGLIVGVGKLPLAWL